MVQAALGLLTNEIKTFPGELQEERMSDLKGKLTIDQNLHSRHILFKAWALYSIIDFKLSSLRTRTIWLLNLTSDIITKIKKSPLISYSDRLKESKTSCYPLVVQSFSPSSKYFMLQKSLSYIIAKLNLSFLKSDISSQCARNRLQVC